MMKERKEKREQRETWRRIGTVVEKGEKGDCMKGDWRQEEEEENKEIKINVEERKREGMKTSSKRRKKVSEK